MGSASSKAGRSAVQSAGKRQYPQRVPPNVRTETKPSEPLTPNPQDRKRRLVGASDQSVSQDGADAEFARSLRSIGPVNPTANFRRDPSLGLGDHSMDLKLPNVYPDPSKNPALKILEARNRLQSEAEQEFEQIGKPGTPGRRYLDVLVVRQVLQMRESSGLSDKEIERRLELRSGTLQRLGQNGVVSEPR